MSRVKSPEDRARRNKPGVIDRNQSGLIIPRPPIGLSAALRRTWDGIWTSPVGSLLDPVSDLPVVARLFELYKLQARLFAMLAKADEDKLTRMLTEDALDPTEEQKILIAEVAASIDKFNSTVGSLSRVATEVRQIETNLGLSPKARLTLGLTLAAAKGAGVGGLDGFDVDENDDGDDEDGP